MGLCVLCRRSAARLRQRVAPTLWRPRPPFAELVRLEPLPLIAPAGRLVQNILASAQLRYTGALQLSALDLTARTHHKSQSSHTAMERPIRIRNKRTLTI